MTYSHLDPAMQNRVAWNAGKKSGRHEAAAHTKADLGNPLLP